MKYIAIFSHLCLNYGDKKLHKEASDVSTGLESGRALCSRIPLVPVMRLWCLCEYGEGLPLPEQAEEILAEDEKISLAEE